MKYIFLKFVALTLIFCCHFAKADEHLQLENKLCVTYNGEEYCAVDRGVVKSASLWHVDVLQNALVPLTIFVCWENYHEYISSNPASELYFTRVQQVVKEQWSSAADVNIYGWNDCSVQDEKNVRILVHDGVPHTKGVGKELDEIFAGVKLNFDFVRWRPRCRLGTRLNWIEKIALHEFGHILGFTHEHNRPDSECDIKISGTEGDVSLTKYDNESIMNYCHCAADANISELDKLTLGKMYP